MSAIEDRIDAEPAKAFLKRHPDITGRFILIFAPRGIGRTLPDGTVADDYELEGIDALIL